jgi:hypothetical protein
LLGMKRLSPRCRANGSRLTKSFRSQRRIFGLGRGDREFCNRLYSPEIPEIIAVKN